MAIYSYNATVTYQVSSAAGGSNSFVWGTTTSYGNTAIGSGANGDELTAVLQPLSPTTTYYYHISTDPSCSDSSGTHYYPGSYSGSLTTYKSTVLWNWGALGFSPTGYYLVTNLLGLPNPACAVIYMTDDGESAGTPVLPCSSISSTTIQYYTSNGVGNAVTVAANPGVAGQPSYAYYTYSNEMLMIWFLWTGSGVSQYYWSPAGGNPYLGDLWYTQDLQLTATMTAQSSSNPVPSSAELQLLPRFNLGVKNVSTTTTEEGTESGSLGIAEMALALGIMAAVVPELVPLALTVAFIAVLADATGDVGEFTGGHTSSLANPGGAEVDQWFRTQDGSAGYCVYICNESARPPNDPSYGSGQNVYGAEDQVYATIDGPFNTGASYDLNVGADNQVAEMPVTSEVATCEDSSVQSGYSCGNAPYPYAGASATESIPMVPAYGFGGNVETSSGGGAPGASVNVFQLVSCTVSAESCSYYEFPLTATSAGYWHFFGDPGTVYVYQACYDSVCSSFANTSSISNEIGLDYETENIQV